MIEAIEQYAKDNNLIYAYGTRPYLNRLKHQELDEIYLYVLPQRTRLNFSNTGLSARRYFVQILFVKEVGRFYS